MDGTMYRATDTLEGKSGIYIRTLSSVIDSPKQLQLGGGDVVAAYQRRIFS